MHDVLSDGFQVLSHELRACVKLSLCEVFMVTLVCHLIQQLTQIHHGLHGKAEAVDILDLHELRFIVCIDFCCQTHGVADRER